MGKHRTKYFTPLKCLRSLHCQRRRKVVYQTSRDPKLSSFIAKVVGIVVRKAGLTSLVCHFYGPSSAQFRYLNQSEFHLLYYGICLPEANNLQMLSEKGNLTPFESLILEKKNA